MRVYVNFHEVRGPYGGANSFLRALTTDLRRRGVEVTNDSDGRYDLAFVNALTDGIDLAFVRRIAERGIPIVHRKVGYRGRGGPDMRRVVDGVVHGDRVQVELGPYVAHSIFQSAYSRDVFLAAGHVGPSTVVHNGVDERVFNRTVRPHPLARMRPREHWDGRSPLRVVVSTWSKDENKGFPAYREIDRRLAGDRSVALTLVGRVPDGTRFSTFRVLPPRRAPSLAAVLKRQHVILQLSEFETCSNALIEGINCGLPAVYLDSGANAEVAGAYGVRYDGAIEPALDALRRAYRTFVERIPENPYRMSIVGERYLEIFRRVLDGERGP